MNQQSTRAQILERRTYLRPLDANGTKFETREQAWRRVIEHQKWLWVRAKNAPLDMVELDELEELYELCLDAKVTVSGRTRWLGGTDISKTREASQFNCAFGKVQTIHDVVDAIWLLLQGCGVGFSADVGVLNGFSKPIDSLTIIRSTKTLGRDAKGNPASDPALKGRPHTIETYNKSTKTLTISVGDSAESWAKFFGKLLAYKGPAKHLIVDFSEIRPAGYRLSGYGWISSGDENIAKAVQGIFDILNNAAGRLLTAIDILDILNWLGTILASRRSAEIALYRYGAPEWREFAGAKKDHTTNGKEHRGMSNNSLLFYQKPSDEELTDLFRLMQEYGGSEPGFINAEAALKRAPYFKGVNPCAEILLGDKSFCNLVETVVSRFNGDRVGLHRAHYLVARANYRQTCVNLDDGILQRTWHELNEFLRLCGVGVTGIIGWEHHKSAQEWQDLRLRAVQGVNDMADELGTPRAQLVTTVKPSGTQSKVSGHVGDEVPEGAHRPLSKYIYNRINFSADDPLVKACEDAGYMVEINPYDSTARLVVMPVEFDNVEFDEVVVENEGVQMLAEVNLEPALDQLERYKILQNNYVDHNCSITIYYSPEEVPGMVAWLLENWDVYVGVSFLYRPDPVAMIKDPEGVAKALGYSYLPQQPVDRETFKAYIGALSPVDFTGTDKEELLDMEECAGGACPIR